MLTRRQLIQTTAAGAGLLAMPGFVLAQSQDKVLRLIPLADLNVLDPIWTTTTITQIHAHAVFDMLYGVDENYVAHPQMAEGHTISDDRLVWTITLREGLKFHDGSPVLARDAVASVKRWGARDTLGQKLMAAVEDLSAPDDKTIVFKLKYPFPLLADALGRPGSNMPAIMPERLASTDPSKQITEMVGSGPFRFKADEWVAGSRAVYEKFEDYVPRSEPGSFLAGGKHALVNRAEMLIIPDPATASSALIAGEADVWESVGADFIPILETAPGITLAKLDVQLVYNLRLNHLQPPFNNPAVRKALLMGVNQADFGKILSTTADGYFTDVGFFSPTSPMASKAGLEVMVADIEAAKKALADSGYDGTPVTLLDPVDMALTHGPTLLVADLLQKIGFKVDLQTVDWGTLVQRRANSGLPSEGGWSLIVLGEPSLTARDPATSFTLRANGKNAWFGWPTSPKIEELSKEFVLTADLEEQKKICEDIQREAFEIVLHVPIGANSAYRGLSERVKSFSNSMALFYNVELI